MRSSLIAVVVSAGALIGLAACGSSSSTGVNPNPHPVNHTVTISNSGFTPQTVTSAVGDTVTWTSSDAVHAISFIAALSPDSLASSGPIAVGQSKFTIFLKTGTYTYLDDSVVADTGVVIVQ
jgi:plastocyanin